MTRKNTAESPAARHHDQAVLLLATVSRWRSPFAALQNPSFVERRVREGLDDLVEQLKAIIGKRCPEEPEQLRGAPIGQYHCGRCGCMVLAAVPHTPHDRGCWLGLEGEPV